jgi:hypothetical protein
MAGDFPKGANMDRRKFLQNLAVTTASIQYLAQKAGVTDTEGVAEVSAQGIGPAAGLTSVPGVEGHTYLSEFKFGPATWKVYEDLRTRDGVITFLSSQGGARVLSKSAEATFAEANPPYLGLSLDDIGLAGEDLLANRLLEGGGDPDPLRVKSAAPPLGSAQEDSERWRLPWNTFLGTKECFDTMPVFPGGSTRTYHPSQYFPELRGNAAEKRLEGLVGRWMPAVRKVMPISDGIHVEVVVFGDVEARDKFIVQTWHRTSRIENGKITKVVFGHSYPAFPPRRRDPKAADFYRALLVFADYWDKQLADMATASLPEEEWEDFSKHAFAKELMVRPGGVYPKYGAVDRDYYGPEYDGFQDIFTSAVYTNLEWGRFETARLIIDNYFTDFVDERGMINMRGPETAQFGLTLSLLARYFRYTKDAALLRKHGKKIVATTELLAELHEESKKLPADDPGYGLIHGWSESDSCLLPDPKTWWLPYYANSGFAARGLRDMALVWPRIQQAYSAVEAQAAVEDWLARSKDLQETVVHAIEKNVRRDMKPPYIGTFPGTKLTFRESMEREHPSPQGWPHRPYSELLEADVLPAGLANLVIDCMRSYGATTLGVVANVGPARKGERAILGFISYGYAQMLLRLDRVEEFLLFLYAHRYHDHTRGSWTAGEVAGIDGSTALFCIPAQQTIPLLVRWMLLLEDSDEDRLYLAKGIPRAWLASGKEIKMEEAPTSWGKISFRMRMDDAKDKVRAIVKLVSAGAPKEIHLKLRLPEKNRLAKVTVNGKAGVLGGPHKDMVIIATRGEREFEVSGEIS